MNRAICGILSGWEGTKEAFTGPILGYSCTHQAWHRCGLFSALIPAGSIR
jgi:hypothetical protein